jgi:transposase
MNASNAYQHWQDSGKIIIWLISWSRRRILRLIQDLFVEYDKLRKAHDKLQRESAEDKQKIMDLEKKLADSKKNSTNSSKPPSSDGPAGGKRNHPRRRKSKRKPGGQPGHAGRNRSLLPPEQVTQVIPMLPECCKKCKSRFTNKQKQAALENNVHRHQVTEMPEIKPEVTEYQFGAIQCDCGAVTRLPIPAEIRRAAGPRLVAFVSYLTVFCRLPRRKVEQLLKGALSISISLGSTQKYVEETSQALQDPYRELQKKLPREPVLNADETSWRKNGEKRWLWVLVAQSFALFAVDPSRGSQVLKKLIGDVFLGILGSDRFSAYLKYHKGIAQFCWAHLKRDLLGIQQLGKTSESERFSRDALALHARLFRLWHRFRGGSLNRAQLISKAMPIEKKFFALGQRFLDSEEDAVRTMAELFFAHIERLFAFIYYEKVEPTNNISERTIRTAVQWRKICFGNRSAAGEVTTARLLTAAATCSIQNRDLLKYLTETVRCHRQGLAAPSLLPQAA